MDVQISAATARKLNDLAASSGRSPEEIVEDALAGYFAGLAAVRETLDSRYVEIVAPSSTPSRLGAAHRPRCDRTRLAALTAPSGGARR